jgi:hypothetical protein
LRSHRTATATYLDGTRIAIVRKRVEVTSGCLPQHPNESRLAEPCDLTNGFDAIQAKFPRGNRADTPEAFNRERVKKSELVIRSHDQEPIRFRDAACDLREEFSPGYSDGDP